jgi:hypothetical protein
VDDDDIIAAIVASISICPTVLALTGPSRIVDRGGVLIPPSPSSATPPQHFESHERQDAQAIIRLNTLPIFAWQLA